MYGNQNPVLYVDYTGESTLIASAALLALGKAVQIVAGAVSIVALSALTSYQVNNLMNQYSYSNLNAASKYIDWGNDNKKHHVLKGSEKSSEQFHGPIWKKFNIDPNNNNDWVKLLPILKKVIDEGYEASKTAVTEHGKIIGHNIRYVKDFVDKGVQVIVKLYVNAKGEVWFSDAWGKFLD